MEVYVHTRDISLFLQVQPKQIWMCEHLFSFRICIENKLTTDWCWAYSPIYL